MKLFLSLAMICGAAAAFSQPRLITQATISTTTNVIAPEEDEVANVQNPGGGGPGAMFRNFGDGETKSTTYLKGSMVKTVIKTDMGRSTIFRNNDTKTTTTLLEMMGNKTGFYVTDEEQAAMRKRMDSMMQARKDTGSVKTERRSISTETSVAYTDESKKISGYNCKKAYIIRTNLLGKDSMAVWYTPDIKLQNVASTGGMSAFGNMGQAASFDKIDGFVMQYEMKMPRGRKMQVEVTKIELDKEVKDKEFEIPKDFDVKPMKEFQNMMRGGPGGGFQMRVGG